MCNIMRQSRQTNISHKPSLNKPFLAQRCASLKILDTLLASNHTKADTALRARISAQIDEGSNNDHHPKQSCRCHHPQFRWLEQRSWKL